MTAASRNFRYFSSLALAIILPACSTDQIPPKSGATLSPEAKTGPARGRGTEPGKQVLAAPRLGTAPLARGTASLQKDEPAWAKEKRNEMVDLVASYDPVFAVTDSGVLEAMRRIPRHKFVPPGLAERAYGNRPLPIGEGQTISQPFIVGYMTQVLELKPGDKVLEVGTGSGYQAAILAELVSEVYTIEIVESLAKGAQEKLASLGYKNIKVKAGDGYQGWPEHAPFDAVIVTCAPDHIPEPLIDQLKPGGRMVIPVGGVLRGLWTAQDLVLVRKTGTGIKREKQFGVRFVPMTGEAQK